MPMRSGFTIIEIILVVGIVAVIGASVSAGTVQILSQSYFTNSVERVAHTLRTAQIYSVSGREDSSWGVHYEPHKLVLFKGTSYVSRDPSFDVETPIPNSVEVTGWSDVYFDRLRGLPSSTPTILIEVLGRAGAVAVTSEGAINRP